MSAMNNNNNNNDGEEVDFNHENQGQQDNSVELEGDANGLFPEDMETGEEFDRTAQSPSPGSWDGLSMDTPTSQLFKESPQDDASKSRKNYNKKVVNVPLELPSKTRLKITVNKLHVTGTWNWTGCAGESCGICRNAFELACSACKFPGDECGVGRGKCSHLFHVHCITKWIDTMPPTKTCCPLCRQSW